MAEPKIAIQRHHYSMDTVEREKGGSNVSCLRPPVSSKQTLRYLFCLAWSICKGLFIIRSGLHALYRNKLRVLPTLIVVYFSGTKGCILYVWIPRSKTWSHNNYIEIEILNKRGVKFLIHWSERGPEPMVDSREYGNKTFRFHNIWGFLDHPSNY